MIKIAPSILSADFMKLGEEISAAQSAGADLLHLDIMDGHFVPNITIGPAIVEAVRKVTTMPLDVHLMISDPDRYLDAFIKAGAEYLTVHVEACAHLHRTLSAIRNNGIKACVSLNPATPVNTLEACIQDVDMVLLMSVNPGFGGQEFIPFVLNKIVQLRKMIKDRGLNTLIEVDGGVKLDNARDVASAGADILVMGSAFFNSEDYGSFIKRARALLAGI
ncbi:MAG: ribulose-phosphate 3-epimerase [Dissulfurispiraceae bacterium]|nr:ribulose-phosphate 3-epimerase [Dissulfurispiraceae bacterium]